MNRVRSWLPICHEVLFALNLALVIVDESLIQARSKFLDYLAYPIWRGLYAILARAYGKPHIELGRRFESVALWILLAGIFVLLLRLLGRTSAKNMLLRAVPGFVAVGAVPAFSLQLEGLANATSRWLLLEVVVACLSTALYLSGRWRLESALSALIASMHFGLWCWVAWVASRSWSCAVYPVLGFSSTVVWASYVKRVAGSRRGNPEGKSGRDGTLY